MLTLTNRIDMRPGAVPLVIHLGQYDSDFSLVFELYSSAGNFTVESGTTAMIRGTKTDGHAYDADATIDVSAKTVTVAGNEQMTAAKGRNVYELVLKKGTKVLSTANFILDVERAAMDADTIASESVLKELNAIIAGAATSTQAATDAASAADRAEDAAESVSSASAQIATNTADIADLKADLSSFKEDVFDEEVTSSANLYPSQALTERVLWNCWGTTVYQDTNGAENYVCFEFDIPNGTEYISSNWEWANNSYSAFVNDGYAKIDLIKNTKTSDSGYVYAVPEGSTKACVSFNNRSGDISNNKYNSLGIVFVVGIANISNKTKDDYAGEISYFADNLKLSSENEATIPEVISALKNTDTKLSGEVAVIAQQFDKKKNLVIGLNEGEFSVAWNVGDTVTTTSNASYAYGYADVEGCEKVTVNMSSMSDAYSFFTDADHKKVATSADNRIGTTRVYNVPTGAKYFYISSADKPVWSQYGLVAFSGNSDIATNPASAEVYPYNETIYFADGLRLTNGGTIGNKLENTGMVFHVEKDGSGDFTSFVEAIQEATKYMDSVVYVGAGEWDIIDEFGSTYMESVTSNPATWGIVLKNRVHVVGTAKTIITAKYTGTTENTRQYFSAFNAGVYGFTLENLEIEADNIRYVIHDDRGNGGQTPYINRYINVSMKLTHGYYGDTVLGGGLGVNGTFEIINCRFEGSPDTHRLAYYHGNNYSGETRAKCKIIVQGCYFANNGSFDVTKYGDSTEMTTAYLSNNSFGSAPQVTSGSYAPQDNMQIVAWNNEIRTT